MQLIIKKSCILVHGEGESCECHTKIIILECDTLCCCTYFLFCCVHINKYNIKLKSIPLLLFNYVILFNDFYLMYLRTSILLLDINIVRLRNFYSYSYELF